MRTLPADVVPDTMSSKDLPAKDQRRDEMGIRACGAGEACDLAALVARIGLRRSWLRV